MFMSRSPVEDIYNFDRETEIQNDRLTEFLIRTGQKLYSIPKIVFLSVLISEVIALTIIYFACVYIFKNHNIWSYIITFIITFVCAATIPLLVGIVIKRFTDLVAKQKAIIEREKSMSDRLLMNVLPYKIISDLKQYGETKPQLFEDVTVFFSDFVGFTSMSTTVEPDHLISELNDIFTRFDEIMMENGCERIKTIGDAFLSVSGMPDKNEKHAENMVKAALDIIDYLVERNEKRELKWLVRIGIHTGPVVGGIVGVHKYIYDVFGDTINTASRLESLSEPMKIHVSEITAGLIGNIFSLTGLPEIDVKGKGMMKSYYVDKA